MSANPCRRTRTGGRPRRPAHGDARGRPPDLLAGDFGSLAAQRLLDLLRELLELFLRHGTVLGGGPDTGHHLDPVERLPLSGPLGHPQRGFLETLIGRESAAAGQALPPSTDDHAFLGKARVDDLVVEALTPRATHTANLVPHEDDSGKNQALPGLTPPPLISPPSAATSDRRSPWGSILRAIDNTVSPGWTT